MAESPQFVELPLTEGKFEVPDNYATTNWSIADISAILLGAPLRGWKFFRVIAPLGLAGAIVGAVSGNTDVAWLSGFVGVAALLLFFYLDRKLKLARRVLGDPVLVVWAHPVVLHEDENPGNVLGLYARLHLRDGPEFDVPMSAEHLTVLFAWLRQQNPPVRLSGRLADAGAMGKIRT